jgi:iron complex outermembrane recepter protein
MIQKLIPLLIFITTSIHLQAQTKNSVTGQIKDNGGKAIASATIMLYNAKDSSLEKTAVCNEKGLFEFEQIKANNYFVTASAVGLLQFSSQIFTVKDGENTTVPSITLSPANKNLKEVVVTSTYKKPLVEVKADRTIFNVESSINATGSNAFELLQKSPGVVTDKDDNIIMKGKNGVRIYIDGRPTQLGSKDLAAYLRSINSADIESIEMISNPSAKYDAAGNAGIINIKFKKNKKFGVNGNFTNGLNIGRTPKTTQSLSLNYRNKKVNLFSNYSNNWGNEYSNFNLSREQNDSTYDQISYQNTEGWNHNLKAGADFFVSKEQTIGVIATINLDNNEGNTDSRTPIASALNGKVGSILYALNSIPSATKNSNYNFNYKFADTAGHEFNFDIDYGTFKSRRTSYQPNNYFKPSPEVFLYDKIYRNQTPTDINITTAKIDYETPLKKGKLGVGVKIANVKTDNTFNFYEVISGVDFKSLSKSNQFNYKENINAAYANYQQTINAKFSIQAGVRLENTVSDGKLVRADGVAQSDDRVQRNYTNLFPSGAITYNVNPINTLNLTYSRRIDRPNYQELNPFEDRLDELTFQKGNAFLKPQYTNSIELTHTFKYMYNTTLSYSKITDFKAQVIDTADKNKSFITQKNLANQDLFNINFSLPFQVTKWWSIYTNINAYHSKYKADFGGGKTINLNINSANIYMQQSFTLGDGFTGELSGFYTAPSIWAGTFKSNALGTLDIGLQKTLFNNKANFKISYTDLLRTLRWAGASDFSGAKIKVNGNWESQQVRLNFSYRFGSNQVKAARERKTASDEESKRTKGGGGFGNN